MKPTRPKQWQRTSPLAVLFFFGRLLKVITKNAWQSLAPFVAFIYAYQGELVTKIVMGATAFLVISITISVLHYWFFRFQLDDDAILIRQGVIKKKQLDIKFDRIQGINTQQNVVYRYFGLVTISFDTAGSSGSEGNLPAVTRSFAESLRSKISGTTEHVGVPAAATDSGALLRLDWRDMLRIGLADRRALIVFAIIGPLLERLGDDADQVIANYLERAADNAFQFGVAGGVIIVTTTVVGLILLFALVSIGAAFLRYHNFELFLDGSRLQSVGGLLTR
ncbi:MAG: PH domain-containing protein, partial [Gammaproteobacteria bacterium]|nr:PH domain-containing protein [Gammaproteobacteria bacterium]